MKHPNLLPLYFVVIRGLHFQNVPITSYTYPAIEPPEHDSQVATQNLNQTMSDRVCFDGDFGEKSDQVTHQNLCGESRTITGHNPGYCTLMMRFCGRPAKQASDLSSSCVANLVARILLNSLNSGTERPPQYCAVCPSC
jgi:hypothetical protein